MSAVTYAIIFNGEIVDGFSPISVKAHMAKLLKADASKIQLLFSGKAIVLKKTTDKAIAAKYGSALKKVGANVRVKIIREAPTTPAPSISAAPVSPAPNISSPTDFSLAPNEGNLFDAAPEVSAPDLDLSGIALSENDGSPIVEATPFRPADIDLSDYAVADNDGSPLVAPSATVAKIEAPDFGLDEPGAMLETLKEKIELLNPDTSSMSLAFPGSDLLNPDEKDIGPAPASPDTSNISLVPNRAQF